MTHRRPFRRPFAPRRVLALTASVVTGVFLLAGCSGGGVQGGGGGTGFVGGTGEISRFAEKDRKEAPDISGETVDGDEMKLSDYQGKVIVLNVWGSWCAPCRAEAPNLAKVSKDTADQGVQFLGINTRDYERANAQAFDRSFDIDYPSFFDPSGKLILKFPDESLAPQLIPSTLVIDREGRIAVRALKALTEEELRDMIDPLLESSKDTEGAQGTKGAEGAKGSGDGGDDGDDGDSGNARKPQGSVDDAPAVPAAAATDPGTPSVPARPAGK